MPVQSMYIGVTEVLSSRKIIHIDADCFYAAIEMRDDPRLQGHAVAVGGSADRRGVIATCNYEARSWGIHSAMSTARAVKLCPDLVIIKPRMEVYKVASKQIHNILHDYTDCIEPLSLDEAFLDVSDCEMCSGSATLIAKEIRSRIWQELRLVVSAGVAPNKFLAKIASDWRKPNGLFVITPDQVDDFVLALPVKKLHGVGKVTAAKLARLGINDCAQLRGHSILVLTKAFGSFGERLWSLARGIDERPVQPYSRRQTVSIERTFEQDLADLSACQAQLPHLLEELAKRQARLDDSYHPDKPFVKVKFHDFTQTTVEQAGAAFDLDSYRLLLSAAYMRGNKPVRLLGVGVRLLDQQQQDAVQLELFSQ